MSKTFTRDELADLLNHHINRYFITSDSYGLAHYLKHSQGDTIVCCQLADALGLEHDWESEAPFSVPKIQEIPKDANI